MSAIAGRPTIDVSKLPHTALDHRSPIWWGNLQLLIIETTMFGIVVAAYFYLRSNFENWPPPNGNTPHGMFRTDPLLGVATLNLALIVLSCIPMILADVGCLKKNLRWVQIGIGVCILMGAIAIWLRFEEFPRLLFRWDDNAYAATIWTILGLHLLHLFTGTLENAVMMSWLLIKGLDDKHARDVRVTAIYWYWIAGTWVILYGVVYVAPRIM